MHIINAGIITLVAGILAIAAIQFSPLNEYFLNANDKSSAFQSIFTFLSFGLALTAVVQYVSNSHKRAKLTIKVKASAESGITDDLSIKSSGATDVLSINVYVQNIGSKLLDRNEAYYFLFFPNDLDFKITHALEGNTPESIIHESFPKAQGLTGYLPEKLWPGGVVRVLTLQLTIKTKKCYEICYYLRSHDGYHPSNMKFDKSGTQPTKKLGLIKIKYS